MDVDVDVVPTFTEGSPRPDLTAGASDRYGRRHYPFDRTSRAHADAERRTLVQPENALDPHSLKQILIAFQDPPPTTQKEKARHVVVKDEPTTWEYSEFRPLMDVIVIPDDERQVLQQQLNSLENVVGLFPQSQEPKDTFELDLDSVMARLRIHNISLVPYPVDLSADDSGVTVTRHVHKFSDKTHLTRFAYLNLNLNPHCPCIPGAPGFQFNGICGGYTDEECAAFYEYEKEEEDRKAAEKAKKRNKKKVNVDVDEDKSEILFARLDRNEWQYEGQYIKQRVPNLTVDEWKQQPVKVRRAWGKKLSSKSYGRTIRANITLRKRLGRKPTPAEMMMQICAAFDCGQAVIHVMSMKCKMPTIDPTKFVQPRKAVKAKGRPVSRSKVQAAKAVATQKRAVAKKATTAKKAASTGSSISTVGGRKRSGQAMESESESEDEDVFVEEN
ncbi:hypothetical protein R3P38DRAFT_2909446, partial [Favolaschia claudopus]